MIFWNLLFILILIGLNAFFVSVEFAAVTSRRARVDLLSTGQTRAAQIVKNWLENPQSRDRLIAASQLGITIVSLALGAAGENTFQVLLEPYFNPQKLPAAYSMLAPVLAALPLVFSLLIVTSVHVVLGEQVPKVAALHNPERVALAAARPMHYFSLVFKWLIDALDWATHRILGMLGLQMVGGHGMLYTVDELKQIVVESEEGGVIQSPEREMLHAVFDFGELLARQVMIPRTEIVAVEADIPLGQIISLVTRSNYTKFPVYDDNLDQMLGIVHVKDLLRAMQQPGWEIQTARQVLREAVYVPETISVNALLRQFRDNRQHIAIVLDEFGGTAGVVTLEDLLEEIVGEVSDQFDQATPQVQTLPDGTSLIDGMTLIEDVNNILGLDLSDEHYDTIAGYILGKLGRIPHGKEIVEADGIRLRVEAMDGLRIARVSLKLQGKNASDGEA